MAVFKIENKARPRFEFQLDGEGEVYSLPSFADLSLEQVKFFQGMIGHEADAYDGVLEFLEIECPGLTKKLTTGGAVALIRAWEEDSGIKVGESSASSSSSGLTEQQ